MGYMSKIILITAYIHQIHLPNFTLFWEYVSDDISPNPQFSHFNITYNEIGKSYSNIRNQQNLGLGGLAELS